MHSADFSCLPVFLFGFGRGFRVTTLATLFISYAYFLASGLDLPTLSVMQRIYCFSAPVTSTLVLFIDMLLWEACGRFVDPVSRRRRTVLLCYGTADIPSNWRRSVQLPG